MFTKGEPLSKELRFRLRGYTGLLFTVLVAFHVSAYFVMVDVRACQTFSLPYLSTNTIRIALFGATGLLYFAAWVEVIRMLYVRWWPHWGTLASGADPYEAAKTAFPAYIQVFAFLAAVVCWLILGCEAQESGRPGLSGALAGVLSGVGGAVLVQYTAWFVRVLEPFAPILPSKTQ